MCFKKETDKKFESPKKSPLGKSLLLLFIGLIFLVLSSKMLVWGATFIAKGLGVSDLIIGLTIVAIGTSLPELASSIAAARKGEDDMALGNILGSNLFNTLMVVGLAGVVAPMKVSFDIMTFAWPVMLALTVLLFPFCYRFKGACRLNRLAGLFFLIVYVCYLGWLIYLSVSATH